jgi:hypothetical protein
MADSKIAGRTGGVLSFTIDGKPYELEASALSVQRFRWMKESTEGLTGPAGVSRKAAQPYIEGTFLYVNGTLADEIVNMEGATVQINSYSGEQYIAEGCHFIGEFVVDKAANTAPFRIETQREIREV